MNPTSTSLLSDITEATRLLNLNRDRIPAEDYEAATIHLAALRFRVAHGDQPRARIEFTQAMNFVNTLIVAQASNGIQSFKQKHFIKLWAHSNRRSIVHMFDGHKMSFEAGRKRKDWVANLRLMRPRKSRYTLKVELDNNDDAFIISTHNDMDRQVLFKEVDINPTLTWVWKTINAAMASIVLNHSVLINHKLHPKKY